MKGHWIGILSHGSTSYEKQARGVREIRSIRSMVALWLTVAMPACVCRGTEPDGSFITFLSHRTGRNLLYQDAARPQPIDTTLRR